MKPGLKVGQAAEIEFTVTPNMFAQFQGKVVHELLSTSGLVHQMEWAARQLILPYLEEHEEGMGMRVDINHLMLTLAGVTVKVRAVVTDIRDNKVEADVEASHFRGKIAKGTVVQAIVQRSWLANKMREMAVVDNIIREEQAIKKS